MQRIRVRYTKEDRVRFVSARDLTAVWERALRRADLPIAYSEGFTPHAKVSFPDALPVGYASTGEYAELTFAAPVDPGPAMAALSASLPSGMDVTTYHEVPPGAPKLARLLGATLWELVYRPVSGPGAGEELADRLRSLCAELLEAEHAPVVRPHPDGDRTVDVRPALLDLHVFLRRAGSGAPPAGAAGNPDVILRAVHRNDGPTVRPTDLHAALLVRVPDPLGLPEPRRYRRVAQGAARADGLVEALTGQLEPLAPERLAGAA